jgi:protein-S-isoprenylcysteine O-methyltransferase Ste14
LADSGASVDVQATSGVKVPPPLFYLAGFAVGIAVELVLPIDRPPAAITVVGVAVGVALWLVLDGTAMMRFLSARTSMIPMRPSTALVTSGPYRFTRNPMYLGMVFAYIAAALAFGVIWALVVLPAVIVAIDRLVIAREEPYLEARFGERYREYKRRVRRWV